VPKEGGTPYNLEGEGTRHSKAEKGEISSDPAHHSVFGAKKNVVITPRLESKK